MIEAIQRSLFDYDSLDIETRIFVLDKAASIQARLKRTAEDIIAIGQDLIEVKQRLGHGKFGDWLKSEFEMSQMTAVKFMRVADLFSKFKLSLNLPVSVLYELAAPSTPGEVIEQVIEGQIPATLPDIREAKQEKRQSELCKIYHCSVADLSSHVEPDSIDFIITDPPYPKEFLSVYPDLAKFAAYALKPGGSLIAMVGQSYLPEIMAMLGEHLTYHWMACYHTPGPATTMYHRRLTTAWKPLLWFKKGEYADWLNGDVFKSEKPDKEYHGWGQSESGMADIVDRLTKSDHVICDPFVGGGATAFVAAKLKRSFVGCDINEACVQKTLQRVYGVL